MHLTLYTDYSLRVLIYLGSSHPKLGSVARISDAYGVSRNHLVKVVHQLGQMGYVETLRGRGGGLRLACEPAKIPIGEVVRRTETMYLVECFDVKNNTCPISPACTLKRALGEAAEAFLAVLDKYTLADFIAHPRRLQQLLTLQAG